MIESCFYDLLIPIDIQFFISPLQGSMTRHIFITGGVVSSLGKGLTAASLGNLLEASGLTINIQKLDPYINVDPGTMNPYQHGEVYVTADGAETDLDLGHYERFTDCNVSKHSNYTTGQIYESVIRKEREGEYLGDTVQVIPHVTDEIKSAIHAIGSDDVDVVIHEIGGTVGDIEGLPFLEAIRQIGIEDRPDRCMYIHLTLVPYLKPSKELKTKPTQHSVKRLQEIGIQPDMIICRAERSLTDSVRKKIRLFCNVSEECVIEEQDVQDSIYEVPLMLKRQNLTRTVLDILNFEDVPEPDVEEWEQMVNRVKSPEKSVEIAMVGKYLELEDAYKSIYESLDHAGAEYRTEVNVRNVEAEEVLKEGADQFLQDVDGILVPGGFGERGITGKLEAVQYAREKKIPFLGLCLGMHCAVIEFARSVCGFENANSTEFDPDTKHPVINLMEEQKEISDLGGTMRLGQYRCRIKENTKTREAYGEEEIWERHRHRYEFNNEYLEIFQKHNMIASGVHPDSNLIEIIEWADHPWFVAVQFHPEFRSRPTKPHPLFSNFIKNSL